MLLALGVVCGLDRTSPSDEGQVVDAAMVDGVALLMAPIANAYIQGFFNAERGTNWLDSGAHYYDVYETSDGQYVSIGAIEPQFYADLLELTENRARRPAAPDGPQRLAAPARTSHRRTQSRRRVWSGSRSSRAPTCASCWCCR